MGALFVQYFRNHENFHHEHKKHHIKEKLRRASDKYVGSLDMKKKTEEERIRHHNSKQSVNSGHNPIFKKPNQTKNL